MVLNRGQSRLQTGVCCCLQYPQPQKCLIRFDQGDSDVGDDVEGQCYQIDKTSAQDVRSVSSQGLCYRRNGQVGCHRSVDLFDRDGQCLRFRVQRRVVYEAAERRKPSRIRDHGDNAPFLDCREDRGAGDYFDNGIVAPFFG